MHSKTPKFVTRKIELQCLRGCGSSFRQILKTFPRISDSHNSSTSTATCLGVRDMNSRRWQLYRYIFISSELLNNSEILHYHITKEAAVTQYYYHLIIPNPPLLLPPSPSLILHHQFPSLILFNLINPHPSNSSSLSVKHLLFLYKYTVLFFNLILKNSSINLLKVK